MHETPRTTETTRTPGAADHGPALGATSVDEFGRDQLERRDLVRWGPILAGLVTVLATLAILSTLGLAIGLGAIEPVQADVGAIDTGAWIWGIATAVIAFFLGGLVAAMSAAVGGRDRGLLNGLMVGAASIAAMLLLIGFGAGSLLGAGATALGDVVNVGQISLNPDQQTLSAAIDRAEDGAWGTFIGLALAVILAGIGGLVGARDKARDEPRR